MKRNAEIYLKNWLYKSHRKPLVLRGARQVGKTWSVRHLAKSENMKLIELNFEKDLIIKEIFTSNNPHEYISLLEMHLSCTINIENSLLFLDEVQAFPQILAKLRWFYEEMPELALIATGSLLDFTLEDHTFSMPVGRISYYYLEPFSFNEFLSVTGNEILRDFLDTINLTQISQGEAIKPLIHKKLLSLFKIYTIVGGMPEALSTWIDTHSFTEISIIQQDLLATYRDDFSKYSARSQKETLDIVMRSLPRMIGHKIKYSNISKEIRGDVIKRALNLLCTAKICHKIHTTSADGLPLDASSNPNKFKMIFLDSGLVSAALGLQLNLEMQKTNIELSNKGAIAEQVVGQLLRTTEPYYIEPSLHYWAREKKGSEAEVDYLVQSGSTLLPIEVKAGSTGSMKSLHLLMAQKGLKIAVRLNSDLPSLVDVNFKINPNDRAEYSLLSLPIYMTEQVKRLTG
ncbi:hypothetical protein LNTAR_07469 [Lentisphaera araneosa HTCC2155]|uniref:AAA family ATPase n=1 Tax=Lentisphaera araneosa HTCC2155 TaxID=313628 RepID=A6DN29_9BACT|nr:AAA family ATPase [Lentisphaera araneosa]EDM27065.1 hypothetical protein LNTAR_07469 [Lentisphaera araneosa HTCC2155]